MTLFKSVLFSLFFFLTVSNVSAQNMEIHTISSLSLDTDTKWLEACFDSRLNSVEIVGLGELSHGAHEPIQFKSKMIKYLIQDKGFRTLFIELDDPMLRELNNYLTDSSPLNKIQMDSVFRKVADGEIFNMDEIRGLLSWIKDYNIKHPDDKANLRGMDLPVDFYYFRDNYIDTAYYSNLKMKWKVINKTRLSLKEQDQVLKEWFNTKSPELKKTLDINRYQQLTRDFNNFKASVYIDENGGQRNSNMFRMRDSIMADNFVKLKTGKAIIWAHNAHIANTGFVLNKFKAKNLGNFLKEYYGNKYYIILTDFSGIANINVKPGKNIIMKKAKASKKTAAVLLADKLAPTGSLIFSADFEFLNLPYNFNNISLEGHPYILEGMLTSFDALIIFKNLTPSILLN